MGSHSKAGVTTHAELTDVHTPHTLEELIASVCSETEAAGLIATHAGLPNAHHDAFVAAEVLPIVEAGNLYVIATGEAGVLLVVLGAPLTVADFQANAGTGTVETPANLNDNNTGNNAHWTAVNQYVEILFDGYFYITEYRQFGNLSNSPATDRWKIQIRTPQGAWVDNTLNIASQDPAEWGDWTPLTTPVWCTGVKIVGTTVGTHMYINELEMRD